MTRLERRAQLFLARLRDHHGWLCTTNLLSKEELMKIEDLIKEIDDYATTVGGLIAGAIASGGGTPPPPADVGATQEQVDAVSAAFTSLQTAITDALHAPAPAPTPAPPPTPTPSATPLTPL